MTSAAVVAASGGGGVLGVAPATRPPVSAVPPGIASAVDEAFSGRGLDLAGIPPWKNQFIISYS